MMTEERVQKLADYMSSSPERMEKLFEMDVEEAQKTINADGYDFTVDELKEFAQAVVTVSEKSTNGELNEDALDDVSGGMLTVGTVSCVCAIVSLGAPYAWNAGQWLGKKICGR